MQRADLCTFGSLQEPRRVGTWGMASVLSENQETAREETAKAADGQRQASHDGRLTHHYMTCKRKVEAVNLLGGERVYVDTRISIACIRLTKTS